MSRDDPGSRWDFAHGGSHSEIPFEAVAQGLAALRKNEWVEAIEERFGIVKVSVAEVRIKLESRI